MNLVDFYGLKSVTYHGVELLHVESKFSFESKVRKSPIMGAFQLRTLTDLKGGLVVFNIDNLAHKDKFVAAVVDILRILDSKDAAAEAILDFHIQRRFAYSYDEDFYAPVNNFLVVSVQDNQIKKFWFPHIGAIEISGEFGGCKYRLTPRTKGGFLIEKNLKNLSTVLFESIGIFKLEEFPESHFFIFRGKSEVLIGSLVDALAIFDKREVDVFSVFTIEDIIGIIKQCMEDRIEKNNKRSSEDQLDESDISSHNGTLSTFIM